ncbi:MAG: recombinase RecA [Dehalococcoidia bacterium]|nr:recombinase RecA [Dehalococcoidia bacterium]MEC7921469.1 recombinase RecA [Chloroflexota bacterium]MEC9451020.1 recombinase RecA [Chloroflexota bacterium]MQG04700.1 recombinase RecA [SAR202 cluster bacterium]|tara:strand:+ start:229 stop:1233 length:1005 start_codon:yes stop_codon:yes gene_type:complete
MSKKETKNSKSSIEETLAGLEKTFGKGSIMLMNDSGSSYEEGVIPTGSIVLDLALGIGGLPRGRIIEIFGAESAGKTTLALSAVAQTQKLGGTAAYIDVEHAIDPSYSQKIGIDLDKLLVSQPDSAEQALEITEYLVKSGNVDLVVVDSVAALVPTAEIEGQMGELQIGLQARLMSQALRKLTGTIRKTNSTAIFINQLREKVGVVFGNPETTPGGRALKFYSSVRIDLRRVEPIKNGTDIVGNKVRARIVKNKMAPPFKKAEMDIIFSEGISRESSIIDLGVEQEIITKSGSFFSYGDERLGQGRESARKFLKEEKTLTDEIDEKIRKSLIEN